MDRLAEALDRNAAEVEAGLNEARHERDLLRLRDRELTELIERAETLLGHRQADRNRTLHEAMTLVLKERGNQWMHTRDIADEVNRHQLYRKRDGSPVETNQIHARSKNYEHLFEKDGPLVRLRTGDMDPKDRPRRPRSKYDPLRDQLKKVDRDSACMNFEEIQGLVGPLPSSAWDHQAWWANERSGSHVQARSWLGAGFRVSRVDQLEGRVWFKREEGTTDDDGLAGDRNPRNPIPPRPEDNIKLDMPDSQTG